MVEVGSFESQKPDPAIATQRRRHYIWAVVGLALVGALGLFAAGFASPRTCISCHQDKAFRAATKSSPHARVQCERCHLAPGRVGQAVFVLEWPWHAYLPPGRSADRERALVPDSRCAECHKTALENTVASKGIRMSHSTCAVSSECGDCHSATAHGAATRWVRSYDMDECLECHQGLKKTACNLCHEDRTSITLAKAVPSTATHDPAWKTSHGLGDGATCSVCHSAADCAACHGAGVPHGPDFVGTHAMQSRQPDAKCESCHEGRFCLSCHGTEMPHPAGFTQRHVAEAKMNPKLCERCHAKSDCTNCHLKHVHPGGAVGATTSASGPRG